MSKWSLDLSEYAKKKHENINTIRKKIAIEIYTQISQKTPVDTGRARGNWQIGLNTDETAQMERKGDATAQETSKLNNLKGDETIFISNNLPYIRALEYGHSKQAPNGMVGTTMAGIKEKIERFVKENE